MKKWFYVACIVAFPLIFVANTMPEQVLDENQEAVQVEPCCSDNEELIAVEASQENLESPLSVPQEDAQETEEIIELSQDSDPDDATDTDQSSIKESELLSSVSETSENDQEDTQESEYLVDALRAVVMTPDGTEVVVQSELDRPSFTGQVLTLDDRIAECCFYLDAVKQKAVASEDQIDRYLTSIQRDNNITLDDLKRTFALHGLTYPQAREQLGRMQTVNTIVELRVMSNVIVSRKDVLAYYEENPPTHEAMYYLQRAVIPFEHDREAQRQRLLKMINAGEANGGIQWSMIFSLAASEIANDKDFIHAAEINQILFGDAGEDGFELYRVVDKKAEQAIPLDECYAYIERILRQPLYEKLMKEYKEKLYERMTIVYV